MTQVDFAIGGSSAFITLLLTLIPELKRLARGHLNENEKFFRKGLAIAPNMIYGIQWRR